MTNVPAVGKTLPQATLQVNPSAIMSPHSRPRLLHDSSHGGSDLPADSLGAAANISSVNAGGASNNKAEIIEPTSELLAELAEVSQKLESASPEAILQWAVDRFGDKFTMATAFGPEGMTIIHMLSKISPKTPIFNLDTGYQFAETLALRERVLERYGIAVEMKKPALSVEEYERVNGGPVYSHDPNRCCGDRKLAVLKEAARGMLAWASAIRRDQSPDRAVAPIVGWDRKFGLVKVSPLANWTKKEVWAMITRENIPYNPLHDSGFMSIGCWPCTRATTFGEDERAGRWSGSAKTECGLHSQG